MEAAQRSWSTWPQYRGVGGETAQEIDNKIREYGEAAAYDWCIQTLDENICGRLQFRTLDIGQNVLRQSDELLSYLSIIASELGENAARPLLDSSHDIGKDTNSRG